MGLEGNVVIQLEPALAHNRAIFQGLLYSSQDRIEIEHRACEAAQYQIEGVTPLKHMQCVPLRASVGENPARQPPRLALAAELHDRLKDLRNDKDRWSFVEKRFQPPPIVGQR